MNRTIVLALGTIACTSSFLIASPVQSEEAYTDELVTFEFPGGNLVEYLTAIDDSFEDCSIVIFPGGLEKIQVPAIRVNTHGHDELLELIENTRASGGNPRVRETFWSITPDVTAISDHVYTAQPMVTGSPFSAATPSDINSSVSVYSGPRNFEMPEILDAIGAGLEMTVGVDGAKVRFHEPTNLIFVDTTSEGHDVVDGILSELRAAIPRRGFGGEDKENESRISDLEGKMLEAREMNAFLQQRLLELEAANTRLRVELELFKGPVGNEE